MKVVVEILTGTLFYVQVEDDATVSDLKRAIEAQENHRYDRLLLMLNGVLSCIIMKEDDALLTMYGVADNSHIYLLFAPSDDHVLPHFLLNHSDLMGSQLSPFSGSSSGQTE